MRFKIKNKIEQNLIAYIKDLDKTYSLSKISPLLFECIKEFISRKGKRLRPILFLTGYLGFTKKRASGLYTSALSIELLHDFMLVHDDIIDKSDIRRGKPSMHQLLNNRLSKFKQVKFTGQDLAIVVGDVMFAIGINAFLAIKENPRRKEMALRKLIEAALYTGSGEYLELLSGLKDIEKIKREDILKIYDYKTAYYTFASPLAIGAILAGANEAEVKKLFQYGIYLGRAFQIKDDILGMFSKQKKIGKSTLTDLREAKKTMLIWYAYNHGNAKSKSAIKAVFKKDNPQANDLLKMQRLLNNCGALEYAKKEILNYIREAEIILSSSKIQREYKTFLKNYSEEILTLY